VERDARGDEAEGVTGDTIFALSSGSPPAAIALVRISGPAADDALSRLARTLPEPRRAALIELRTDEGPLDRAIVLRFPGPDSVTGEDVVELHLHGGRAVVAAILDALGAIDGLRAAEPGEFTRRAFEHGRIDLAEAEGLADLLTAETESQRRAALAMAGGSVSRLVADWQERLLALSARLEAALDFSDEGEVGDSLPAGWTDDLCALAAELEASLARPPAERLRDGVRIVIAGPPNAGKSSLLNVLAGREAAITSALPGTTRDLVEAPTAIGGMPFLLVDTAGLRDGVDEVERIGVDRAKQSLAAADLILWLGEVEACPDPGRSIMVESKADLRSGGPDPAFVVSVSAVTGQGMNRLFDEVAKRAAALLPRDGDVAINRRHRDAVTAAHSELCAAQSEQDFLLLAESLRRARLRLDRITGRSGVEDMLDALFARLCIGK
jgi:tRNA modification GTPase